VKLDLFVFFISTSFQNTDHLQHYFEKHLSLTVMWNKDIFTSSRQHCNDHVHSRDEIDDTGSMVCVCVCLCVLGAQVRETHFMEV